MAIKIRVNNVFSLQVFQILRFTVFLLISVFFTKSQLLSVEEIGEWELMLFITSGISYFWITGIIQSLIPLYNNNSTFQTSQRPGLTKSPELFNTFLLLTAFSAVFTLLILVSGYLGFSSKSVERIPYHNLLALYFFFNNPGALIEYIYLLKNKPQHILYFGIISFFLLLAMVCLPIYFGLGLIYSIWGLIVFTILRYLFLVFLIVKYSRIEFSWAFMKSHLTLGYPLILSALLSGSTQYIDGFLASVTGDARRFAVFRFGTKELPFVNQLAGGLSNAMLTGFSNAEKIKESLKLLKIKSLKLMHYLFPFSIVVMIFSNWIFGTFLFNENFYRSADVFMVYLLIIIARLVFPQTILIGLKKTKIILSASIISIIMNILLSLFFIQHYGIVGLALGTVVVLVLEKIFLILYNYYKLGIRPTEYIPVKWYLFYSAMIVLVFVLIDHRIIMIY